MRAVLLLLLLLLSGCKAAPQIAGLVTGAIAGGATANPAVGFAVGVGTVAAADYAFKYETRRWHRSEQDAIASVAGALPEGGQAPWRIRHDLPLGNERGRLEVVRVIANPLAPCKRVLFSVQEDETPEAWYSADICQQATMWKWATAEPAVERWGYLQ
ncbi:MAG: hypothetical protein M3Y41_19805 [Pseudomonadota bacterium]|nr:hypothetical protein [Pseudomonadota bacterium]